MIASVRNTRNLQKKKETQLHILQPRMADTLYVAAYFRSMRQLRYYYFPKGIEREGERESEKEIHVAPAGLHTFYDRHCTCP